VAAFVLPFEKPVVDLVEKVKALRTLAAAVEAGRADRDRISATG